MKTIKVSEATRHQLNWMVAKAANLTIIQIKGGAVYTPQYPKIGGAVFDPTTDWAQGGPIIEKGQLLTNYAPDAAPDENQPWVSDDYAGMVASGMCWGATPLIAAMRCYIASKLGDEVEVPDELA